MLKGINHWSFPRTMPLQEVFAHCAKAGYDALELTLNKPDRVGFTLESTERDIREAGRMAEAYGIRLRSLSTGLMLENSLSSPDAAVRERGRGVVMKQLEIASLLGMDTILTVPAYCNEEVTYAQCYERSQEELFRLIPLAEQAGVRIGIENVWNKFLLSPLEMARYIDEMGSPALGAYFDIGNVMLYGHPEQWIDILGRRIFKVHAKDFRRAAGHYHGFVPLLSGDVKWNAVASALLSIGYEDTLTAEISGYAEMPLQAVYDTARQLTAIIGGQPG
ncbi:sugar phosphate isomerase/epimerase family protein [Paenibacillus cymbidii]|uniref:sugar phosphate isomerase/epimerase family protein n=1 Tax=Paenibacillus cymbidii TaxID=1639034 RepID=UPI001080D0F7|nr:sugar phosphate isomerase/epimerase family protein [Paenibacillus cymbidii]